MTHPHNIVQKAIAKGTLISKACERCGIAETVAHHEDYSRPLDVIWLCRKCHKGRHRELKKTPGEYVPYPDPVGWKEITALYLEPELKQKLVQLAEVDGRSLSSLIAKIVADWIKHSEKRR